MDPRSFLLYAEQLADLDSAGPAEYRSSISRSYDAAYNVAVKFLRTKVHLEPVGGGDKHSAVKAAFMQSNNDDARRMSMMLDTLHTQRKNADYELEKPGTESQTTAQACARQARGIVEWFDSIQSAPDLLKVVIAAVSDWAQTAAGRKWLRRC